MIKITHFGEDYATVEVDGVEYEASLGNICHDWPV